MPQMYAISDSHDRIMVLMTHNTDISDAWEREGEDPRFFYQFSPDGYAVGHQRAHVRDDALRVRVQGQRSGFALGLRVADSALRIWS